MKRIPVVRFRYTGTRRDVSHDGGSWPVGSPTGDGDTGQSRSRLVRGVDSGEGLGLPFLEFLQQHHSF